MKDTKIAKKNNTESLVLFEDLVAIFEGDTELAVFFIHWFNNNRNATKAAKLTFPNKGWDRIGYAIKGSKMLEKVKSIDKNLILEAYGINTDTYVTQLKDGIKASKFVDDGEGMLEVPDHKVRREYHKTLGVLLGFESDSEKDQRKFNVNKMVNNWFTGGSDVIEGEETE